MSIPRFKSCLKVILCSLIKILTYSVVCSLMNKASPNRRPSLPECLTILQDLHNFVPQYSPWISPIRGKNLLMNKARLHATITYQLIPSSCNWRLDPQRRTRFCRFCRPPHRYPPSRSHELSFSKWVVGGWGGKNRAKGMQNWSRGDWQRRTPTGWSLVAPRGRVET